jgi:hypothetical protein
MEALDVITDRFPVILDRGWYSREVEYTSICLLAVFFVVCPPVRCLLLAFVREEAKQGLDNSQHRQADSRRHCRPSGPTNRLLQSAPVAFGAIVVIGNSIFTVLSVL